MNKFQHVYSVSEGDYQMDIFTGITISADSRETAMKIAETLEGRVKKGWVTAFLYSTPHPHLKFDFNQANIPRVLNTSVSYPAVLKCEILCPKGGHEILMGFPIYTMDDFVEISEQEFIRKMAMEYVPYFHCKNRPYVSFETLAYGVEEVK